MIWHLDIYEDFYPALQIVLKLSEVKQYLVFILNFQLLSYVIMWNF